MDAKKKYVIGGIILGLMLCIIAIFVFPSKKESPKKVLYSYIESLQKNDYESMYNMVSTSLSKKDFVNKLKNIYKGIEMKDVKMEILKSEEEKEENRIQYRVCMNTLAGNITYKNRVRIKKVDGEYKIQWDVSQIFPSLKAQQRVAIQVLHGQRGSLLDRNGTALAKQGFVYNVGLIAGRMDNEAISIKAMADVLGMKEEQVKAKLSARWVKDDMFVPIKMVSEKEKNKLSETLHQIDGVSIQKSLARVYPYGEMTAHITGYVQNISAEELQKHKKEGYTKNSVIGKSGLEQVYEKQLKGKNGYEICIVDMRGKKVKTLAKKQEQNGQDITTTIDIKAQEALYAQLQHDAGAGVMLNSHTGEVLGMVSTPSYDPNAFVVGISSEQWNVYNDATTTPLLNRVTNVYAPGSTFKAITGVIGLDSKTIDASSQFEKSEKWQKDKSWGNNYVTTTQSYPEPSDLQHAFIYSDNIFFAQLADKIGAKTFQHYLDEIGFEKKMDFSLALTKSTYGKIQNDQMLAATGYGQGQLLISPLHLSALYTAYKNDGTILQPYLIYDQGKSKILKKQAYTKESATLVFNDLQKTMDSYGDNPTKAAGKTGTAQVKNGNEEIGWLCAVNDKVSITLMVDDTKNIGESHYMIPKMQALLRDYE